MLAANDIRSYYVELIEAVETRDVARYRVFLRHWSQVVGSERTKALQASGDETLAARLRYLARSLPVSRATQTEAARWLRDHGYPLEPPEPAPRPRRSPVKRKA